VSSGHNLVLRSVRHVLRDHPRGHQPRVVDGELFVSGSDAAKSLSQPMVRSMVLRDEWSS